MLLRYCVFLLTLVNWGCLGAQWQVIEEFKITLGKYSRTGDDIIRVIDNFIHKKKYDSRDFLNSIDNMPYLERSELRPSCALVHQRLDGLVYSFKTDIVKMETPLISIKLEIKDRLSDIYAAIDVYQRLADNKRDNCRGGNYLCEDGIISWLRNKINKIHCRVSNNCWREKNHTRVSRSASDCEEFQCASGECITYDEVCNGDENCKDASDETPGCQKYCFNGFHCNDLRCIEKKKICDGVEDCGDGSDEENCKRTIRRSSSTEPAPPLQICSPNHGKFMCTNERCVSLAAACDGKDDCGDNSDEGPQCGNETLCVEGCTASGGVCFLAPRGALCIDQCPDGTADDGGICRLGPRRASPNLEELFEQVPYLLERYVGAVGLLKRRLIRSLEEALQKCLEISSVQKPKQ